MTYLILGAAGQDGILAMRLLRERGEEFYAAVRAKPAKNHPFWAEVRDRQVRVVDVTKPSVLSGALDAVQPTRILNLAGFSDVRRSWDEPEKALNTNAGGALNLYRAVLQSGRSDAIRIYQASSSEVFGRPSSAPQTENTPMMPVTPYGVSKAAAQSLASILRERFGLWVSVGILFNHESPLRSEDYVVRHVIASAVRMKLGHQTELEIGDLSARRDWGFAPDYVEGMLRMIEHGQPEDFVLATGLTHSVGDVVDTAFEAVEMPTELRRVRSTPARSRPVEPVHLLGDATKARRTLGWKPSVGFREMIGKLVQSELGSFA